jgi:predicted GNAT family acetyltransferase
MTKTTVTDVPEARRYEAKVGGRLAGVAVYLRTPDMVALIHTEVEPEYEGQGIGSALARRALDDARSSGRQVLAACPFISGWIAHHPEYKDLEYQSRSRVAD